MWRTVPMQPLWCFWGSMVRAFDHGAMDRWIDPSWWTHWAISRSSLCYPSLPTPYNCKLNVLSALLNKTFPFFLPIQDQSGPCSLGSVLPSHFILQGVDPLSYFSFQPVLHDWYNKGRGMCYPVCGMVHIKEPLLLIGKSSPCGGSGFPLSLSEWSFTICPMPYNRK